MRRPNKHRCILQKKENLNPFEIARDTPSRAIFFTQHPPLIENKAHHHNVYSFIDVYVNFRGQTSFDDVTQRDSVSRPLGCVRKSNNMQRQQISRA